MTEASGSSGFGDAELEPRVQEWARGLAEPELGSDWTDVIRRSRVRRRVARRKLALVVACTLVALAALGGGGFELLRPSTAPVGATAILPAGLGTAGGVTAGASDSSLVLYSGAPHSSFQRDSDDRARGLRVRYLEVFNARLPVRPARGSGPLAGDQESLTFVLYSDASLKTRSGSAVVSCLYGTARNAFCNASIELRDGSTLTGTGMLQGGSLHFSFALTGGTGRFVSEEGAFEDVPTLNHDLELKFQFV